MQVSQLRFTSLFAVVAIGYMTLAMVVHFAVDVSIAPEQTLGEIRYFPPAMSEGARRR